MLITASHCGQVYLLILLILSIIECIVVSMVRVPNDGLPVPLILSQDLVLLLVVLGVDQPAEETP